jgi:hypothetical protein
MEVSKLKNWVSMPSTESALPNSRVGQRGPLTLLYLSRRTKRNAPDEAMIAGIPNRPSMTNVDWFGRSNGRTGRDQNDTEQLRDRRTAAAHHRTPPRTAVF